METKKQFLLCWLAFGRDLATLFQHLYVFRSTVCVPFRPFICNIFYHSPVSDSTTSLCQPFVRYFVRIGILYTVHVSLCTYYCLPQYYANNAELRQTQCHGEIIKDPFHSYRTDVPIHNTSIVYFCRKWSFVLSFRVKYTKFSIQWFFFIRSFHFTLRPSVCVSPLLTLFIEMNYKKY